MRVDQRIEAPFTAAMRVLLASLLLVVVATGGCAHKPTSRPKGNFEDVAPVTNAATRQNLRATQELVLIGRIVSANPIGRFVVVNFPLGKMPTAGQRFSVYRQGLKMGELRITGPQHDDNVVADISAGDATVGDEVRVR